MIRRLAAWVAIAPFAAFVALRALGVEQDHAWFFALVTLTPVLLLPAWIVLVVAGLQRQWFLVSLAGMIALTHVAWVAPDLRWWPATQPDAGRTEVRLVAANVWHRNERIIEMTNSLRRLEADVLVVEELTPRLATAIRSLGYPYAVEDPSAETTFGNGIYSRLPLRDPVHFELDGYPAIQATMTLPEGDVTLVAVHTLQPLKGLNVLRRQLRQLDALAARLRSEGKQVVLAGDFNASRQHRDFRKLVDDGMRDAHADRGRGRVRTWPVGKTLPPFAHLDHVLVSDGIAVLEAESAGVPGSDHRAVVVRLARAT